MPAVNENFINNYLRARKRLFLARIKIKNKRLIDLVISSLHTLIYELKVIYSYVKIYSVYE